MNTRFTLALSVTLMTLAGAVFAYPTLAGPTGLAVLPTAEVITAGHWQLAADYYNTQDSATGVRDTVPIRLLYGIAPNWEVGVDGWIAKVNGANADTYGGNLKYQTPLRLAGFDLAIGVIDQVTKKAADEGFSKDANTFEAYLAGTRELIKPTAGMLGVNATLGVNWTKLDAGMEKGEGYRFAGGIEVKPFKTLSIAAELQTKRAQVGDDKALAAVTARYMLNTNLQVEAGYTNAGFNYGGLTGTPDHNFFAGLAFEK